MPNTIKFLTVYPTHLKYKLDLKEILESIVKIDVDSELKVCIYMLNFCINTVFTVS